MNETGFGYIIVFVDGTIADQAIYLSEKDAEESAEELSKVYVVDIIDLPIIEGDNE